MQVNEKARFEFRIFGNALGQALEEMLPALAAAPIQKQTDIYLLTTENATVNATVNLKLRDNCLNSKRLMRYQQGLERWHPYFDLSLPITAAFLQEFLFPLLAVPAPPLHKEAYAAAELLDLIALVPEMRAVRVHKQRRHCQIDGCQVEAATLYVANHFYTRSVALEAVDALAVQRLRARLGLLDEENVNYNRGLTALLNEHPSLTDELPVSLAPPVAQSTFARVGW
jgi:hypothetical protein